MKVGENIQTVRANWSFDNDVADDFVDHISKSVPFYKEGHDLVCDISDFFVHDKSICYELGTSTGELLRKLAEHNAQKPNARWIGIDSIKNMTLKAKQHCKDIKNIEIVHDDINLFPLEKSDFVVSYYTLQFVPPRLRQEAINKIYESLNWGGAFVMFEKVRGPDARFQDIATQLYHEYKLKQGYSPEQIMNKMQSLKSVLEPFSTQGNVDLLKRAGFQDVTTFFKYICFEGFVAIK